MTTVSLSLYSVTATSEFCPLSLHDALPICDLPDPVRARPRRRAAQAAPRRGGDGRYEPERGAPGEGDEPLPPPGGRAGLARRLRGRGGGQADVGEPGSAQPAARAEVGRAHV